MNGVNPNLLIIGHGRHGKDTACELLQEHYGLNFISSSMFVAQEVLWPEWGSKPDPRKLWLKPRYTNIGAMYEDRHSKRGVWFRKIRQYNTPDRTKTAKTMLDRGYDIYCGMRSRDEFEACNAAHLFDAVLWIDRSHHLPPESADSMELDVGDATHLIDNNTDIHGLAKELDNFMEAWYYG